MYNHNFEFDMHDNIQNPKAEKQYTVLGTFYSATNGEPCYLVQEDKYTVLMNALFIENFFGLVQE